MILLPGVNHSHLSNGEVREGSGDLFAVASLAEANEAAGGAIADFLVTNFCPVRLKSLWPASLGLRTPSPKDVWCSLLKCPSSKNVTQLLGFSQAAACGAEKCSTYHCERVNTATACSSSAGLTAC